jgi:choline-sulfatase
MTEEWQAKGHWDAYAADYKERFANRPWVVRPSTLPLELYYDTWVGQRACRYLRDYERAEPWCCWVSFGGPHEPWDTPEPYASRYAPESMPTALPRFTDAATERPRGQLDRMPPKAKISPTDVAAMRADYAGNVALIDDQVGELIATIQARGEWENTVVMLCSDHGEMNGDHGLIYKSNFLDSALRIPLLVSTPATRAAGTAATSEALVEWFDVGATLADYAGATLHQQYARSLSAAVADPAAAHRDYAISELAHEVMIMTAEWKLALNTEGQPYLLFDRAADPREQRNLAGDPAHAEVERELRDRIFTHIYTTQM